MISDRRSFLKRAGLLLAGWRGALGILSVPLTGVAGESSAAASERLGQVPGYLTPSYLPSGYRFYMQDRNRHDGMGGDDEVALFYRDSTPPIGNRPLYVFQTYAPTRPFFATEHRLGRAVMVPTATGSVPGEYHDGFWVGPFTAAGGRWMNDDIHSIRFSSNGLTVAIRGSRYAGVTFDDLLRVAASLR